MTQDAAASHLNLHLHHYWRSSCSWRLRWALNFKGLPYQSTAVNLLKDEQSSPAYRAINPSGLVPSLTVNGRVMTDSLAIIEWLEEVHPEPALLPRDSMARADVRALSMMIAAGIQPVANLRVLQHLSPDSAARRAWSQHFIALGLGAFEAQLQKLAGEFCYGDTLTMADLFLVPQIYNALRVEIDLSEFPLCRRIYEACLKRTDCDRAAPHNQEGATA